MKRCNSLKLFALLSIVVGQAFAYSSYDCCGPLEPCRWYVMPKVGAAPGIWSNRGHERRVVPSAGFPQPITCPMTFSDTIVDCADILPNPENIFQEDCCPIPKFSRVFTNGVLHVGGEIGYITDCHCLYFIDLFYNRANGSCVSHETKNVKALDGCCPDDCNTVDCNNPLSISQRTDTFEDYSSYGAYIGNRYYFNRVWCDRLAFFLGLKAGIMHRNDVCVCTNVPEQTSGSTVIFAERNLTYEAFCKSNSVSGGIQVGIDYCINDCLAFMVGFEVLATCPFKVNKNISVAIPTPEVQSVQALAFPFPTNLVVGSTGTFVQFPIWAGLRWEWDFCCDPCNNN